MSERVKYALELVKGISFEEAKKLIPTKIGTSWFMIEAFPAALAVYSVTKDAKEAALLSFHIGYNHTIPEIACALHGAEKGPSIFPDEVVKKIESVNKIDINKLADEMISKI